ncbi:alanine--tRNA ligase [Corynebacterium kroppenstedtii]|uniref:alanine--tRNA ligase n=1 Tax=Corynebacterium sp. PCR 32 TaxID=3351342 RepID=UPI0030A95C25
MYTHEIRERFTEHFVKAGHTSVPSASLILDDPNLLFVNAGMVPFKPYFLGQQTPPFDTATSIQKCVRTLDIDEVGMTTRHNTFFQMAGNFSFGNYFKEGAISHAWSLLTNSVDNGGFGLDPDRLWVTIFQDDDEAGDIWHEKIGIPRERIQRLGMADNYWSMGIPGPCGPSSEIYYDRGPEFGKEGGPVVDDTRYIEIWNLVFMEKERGEGIGKEDFEILGSLPKKNIDTGLGIERVACILQGVDNVYETDLLRPVIDVAEDVSGTTYGKEHTDDVRFRVIADHCRTALMLILDGVAPSNEGRGYILRRLLRRIVRSARLLGASQETMERFMETVRTTMTPSYPEIEENWERIRSTAVAEEKAFLATLESGEKLFSTIAKDIKDRGESTFSGEDAFVLHDTHGFPVDLTAEMAHEHGLALDRDAFDRHMQDQKARAKADSQAKKHGHADLSVYRPFVDNYPTTFTGYDSLDDEGTVLGLVAAGQLVDKASEGDHVDVILDRTPFYAESGGQMADHGTLSAASAQLVVNDVQKIGKKLWVHKAVVTGGEVAVGMTVNSAVDRTWRHAARQAHSGTHVIHAALRHVLGPTAVQAGSMNKPGYLRFDFNFNRPLTEEQVNDIQNIANSAVDSDYAVNTVEMSLDEAKKMGAMALFGQNYGDQVRVVEIGGPFSMELCGGTHVDHSSQIGPIAVLGDSSVGSGARRIEAYTGMDSFRYLAQQRTTLSTVASSLKAPASDVPDRVDQLAARLHDAERAVARAHQQHLQLKAQEFVANAQLVNGVRVVAEHISNVEAKDLRMMAHDLTNRLGADAACVVLISSIDSKVPFVVAANDVATRRGVNANALVKVIGHSVGGRGGGKPDMAQGSGNDATGIPGALDEVFEFMKTRG